jgi:glyoxylate/hydroxypyruvate reductase A
MPERLDCVLLSAALDLRDYLAPEIARLQDHLRFVDHPAADPERVRLAVAWLPPDDGFARYPNLTAACSIGAGADSILRCPSLRDGIHVVRVVEPAQAQMMSGFVLWHVVGHQRQMATYQAQQRDRLWLRVPQRAAREVPVAVLGFGAIGSRVAQDLAALGFPVRAWSRGPRAALPGVAAFHGSEGFDAAVTDAEVVINLLPLTGETRGILDARLFGRMRRGGFLVHVGRGEHLNEADLLAALDGGQLAGAALDVFAVEPLPADHAFWCHPRVTLTPHDACDVSLSAVGDTLRATAAAVAAGAVPANIVDRGRGY